MAPRKRRAKGQTCSPAGRQEERAAALRHVPQIQPWLGGCKVWSGGTASLSENPTDRLLGWPWSTCPPRLRAVQGDSPTVRADGLCGDNRMRHLRRHTAHTGSPRRLVPCSSPRRRRWGAPRDSRYPPGHPRAVPRGAYGTRHSPPLASPSVSPCLGTAAPFPQPRHIWQELTQPTFSFPRRQPLCRPRRANSVVVHLQPAAGARCGSRRAASTPLELSTPLPKMRPRPRMELEQSPLAPCSAPAVRPPKTPTKARL